MYHERQVLQRCLLHTLNNLLQQQPQPAWSVQSLNALSDGLPAAQRTRWLGNYDANVLAAALQQHGLEVEWHDARDTQLSKLACRLRATASCSSCDTQQQGQRPQHQQPHQQQQQQQQQGSAVFGLVLNVAGQGLLSALTGGRHWLAIRWLQGAWWNLDSKLPHPVSFEAGGDDDGGTAALCAFLQQQLSAGAHLLIITESPQLGALQREM